MDLTNLFTAQTAPPEQMIICIILTDTSVQALLLAISVSDSRVVSQSSVIPYTDQANCLIRTDETLQELGAESEKVNEVLFAVEDSWIEAGDVDSQHQGLLKEMTENLSLKPMGFVVQSEALFQHYLNVHQQFSAVMLLFATSHLTVQVVRQGRLQYSSVVGRSENIANDVKEALARYVKAQEGEALPAKIVCSSFVLAMTELKALQQQLLEVEWGNAVPFVQSPTIDVLDVKQTVQAVAKQAGQALLAQISPEMLAAADRKQIKQIGPDTGPTPEEKAESAKSAAEASASATSFGVPISSAMLKGTADEVPETAVETEAGAGGAASNSGSLSKIKGNTTAQIVKANPKKFIIAGLIAGLVVLAGIIIVYTSWLSQVTAVISPKQISVSKEISITLDPAATEADLSQNIIPAETVTLELTTQEEVETTGIKIVGDEAKGRVILYNKTEADKRFPEGTILEFEEMQFLLDAEVVVPAAETEEQSRNSSTITFGEREVNVTAYQIGVEGNIPEETDLTVENFDSSTYSASSVAAFTGGSSREVRVVSEADVAAVLEKARQSMLSEANQRFSDDSGGGRYVIDTETIETASTTYSHELEVEADILTATVTATVTTLAYNVQDLRPIATAALASEIPDDYTIFNEDPQILSSPVDDLAEVGEVVIAAQVTSEAHPSYDEDQLKSDIAGKSLEDARSTLEQRSTIEKVTFVHYPAWVRVFARSIPTAPTRISIQEAEE